MSNPIYTDSLSVDPVTPANVVAPGDYDYLRVFGLDDASLFFRGGAGQAEVEILAGSERTFGGKVALNERGTDQQYGTPPTRRTRFRAGDVALQLRSSSGAGPVFLEWS